MRTKTGGIPESKYFLCTLSTQAARKVVSYYNRELASVGLTAQQLVALGVLIFEENLSLVQFSRRLKIGKAAAATMVERLISLGLVVKETHPEDARSIVLKITQKTRDLQPVIEQKVVHLEKSVELQTGVEDLEMFVAHLEAFSKLDL